MRIAVIKKRNAMVALSVLVVCKSIPWLHFRTSYNKSTFLLTHLLVNTSGVCLLCILGSDK